MLESQNVLAEEKWIWTRVIHWSGKGIQIQVQITVKWEGPKYSAQVSLYKVSLKLFILFYTFTTYSIAIRKEQTCSDGFKYRKHLSQPKGWREQGKWSEELLQQAANTTPSLPKSQTPFNDVSIIVHSLHPVLPRIKSLAWN